MYFHMKKSKRSEAVKVYPQNPNFIPILGVVIGQEFNRTALHVDRVEDVDMLIDHAGSEQ